MLYSLTGGVSQLPEGKAFSSCVYSSQGAHWPLPYPYMSHPSSYMELYLYQCWTLPQI